MTNQYYNQEYLQKMFIVSKFNIFRFYQQRISLFNPKPSDIIFLAKLYRLLCCAELSGKNRPFEHTEDYEVGFL